jgi:hypothetical protein
LKEKLQLDRARVDGLITSSEAQIIEGDNFVHGNSSLPILQREGCGAIIRCVINSNDIPFADYPRQWIFDRRGGQTHT